MQIFITNVIAWEIRGYSQFGISISDITEFLLIMHVPHTDLTHTSCEQGFVSEHDPICQHLQSLIKLKQEKNHPHSMIIVNNG